MGNGVTPVGWHHPPSNNKVVMISRFWEGLHKINEFGTLIIHSPGMVGLVHMTSFQYSLSSTWNKHIPADLQLLNQLEKVCFHQTFSLQTHCLCSIRKKIPGYLGYLVFFEMLKDEWQSERSWRSKAFGHVQSGIRFTINFRGICVDFFICVGNNGMIIHVGGVEANWLPVLTWPCMRIGLRTNSICMLEKVSPQLLLGLKSPPASISS